MVLAVIDTNVDHPTYRVINITREYFSLRRGNNEFLE